MLPLAGPVVDGSAAAVVAVGVLSGAPVLVFTVNAGTVRVGRPSTPEHAKLNSKKENA